MVAVDRDAESAARTAELARLVGAPEAWAEPVDVTDEQAMEKLAEKVATEYGVVDVLVNNAGIGLSGSFLDTTPEDWKKVLDVNLWGVIHGCRLFGKQMAERGQGGHIVNIASAAAYQPSNALSAYSTSKAAVLMLSECLRAELAAKGIGVSAICPGLVNTEHHNDRAFHGSRRRGGGPPAEADGSAVRVAQLPAGEGGFGDPARGGAQRGGRTGDAGGPGRASHVPFPAGGVAGAGAGGSAAVTTGIKRV